MVQLETETWNEIKSTLRKIYLPIINDNIHDQAYTLIQDNVLIIECTKRFEELKI